VIAVGAALGLAAGFAGLEFVGTNAASGGGCLLHGTANFTPGLTNNAASFTYNFGGALSNCHSNDATAPATGTIGAGLVVTGAGGEQFQEPVSASSGTCGNGTTNGTGIINWADGTATVVGYQTTSAAAAVHLIGTVVASVTLPAINPAPGQPTSMVISTTRYAGDSALGQLAFQADPTKCQAAPGVTSAGIDGAAELVTQN
jgi:hypothetical protein